MKTLYVSGPMTGLPDLNFPAFHAAAAKLPDADLTVLLWVRYADGTSDWAAGWWDGDCWRDAASGGPVSGTVTHWAEPAGPLA
jgi:hypothetical protein